MIIFAKKILIKFYTMKKHIIILCIVATSIVAFAQNDSTFNKYPKLYFEIPIFHHNFINYAAKTVSNSQYPNFNVKYYDYLKAYANPSMQQSLMTTAGLYNLTHWSLDKLQINWFNSDFLNHIIKSTIWGSAEILLMYTPLGGGWLHEEYHRAVMTKHYTNSFNDMNTFPLFASTVSVNSVTDENLIRMKLESNPDFVRLHAAGIEGEYMLTHQLQKQNFFYNQNLTYFASNLLSTANSIAYVWMCSRENGELFTDQFLAAENENIKERDFTGLDFVAWAYDLFNPDEPYEARGIHPSGNGINRYRKPSDLTEEQNDYLRKQGYLQLINLSSPMLLGINHIPINKTRKIYANFAVRHLLTSFGHDISPYIFLKTPKYNFVFGYHHYKNYNKAFSGIELELYDLRFPLLIIMSGHATYFNILFSVRTLAWLQPENQKFMTSKMTPGALLDMKLKIGIKGKIFPYLQITGKTPGWVAGNVFLEENISFKFGMSFHLD